MGEEMDDLMPTTPLEGELADYVNSGNVVMRIAKSKIKGLVANEVDSICTERTRAKFQCEMEKTFADMLRLVNGTDLTKSKRHSLDSWKR